MISVSLDYVESLAFNSKSFVNSKKIVTKGQIVKTCINDEGNLIFGECSGSGKSTYKSSIDFMDEINPVFRCSCPSRQIPCKHSIAVLYKYALDKTLFVIEEVPEDIQGKREKVIKKEENKAVKKPAKVNISAFIKKLEGQLDGISDIEIFIDELILNGLSNITDSKIEGFESILSKNLKANLLSEHRFIVAECIYLFRKIIKNKEAFNKSLNDGYSEKSLYRKVIKKLITLKRLNKDYREEIEKLIKNNSYLDVKSAYIFNRAGQVIKFEELEKMNLILMDRKLVQLSFEIEDDSKSSKYIYRSHFIDTENGELYENTVIKPYSIASNIKSISDVSGVIEVESLAYYKKSSNTKIVLNSYKVSSLDNRVIEKVKSYAKDDFSILVKSIKSEIVKPLRDNGIIAFIKVKSVMEKGRDILLVDKDKNIIKLRCSKDKYDSKESQIKYILNDKDLKDLYLTLLFEVSNNNEISTRVTSAIIDNKIIKFF